MPTPPLERKLAELTITAIEKKLRSGHRPKGTRGAGQGAVCAVAEETGVPLPTIYSRLLAARKTYGLEPDWSLYEAKPEAPQIGGQLEAAEAVKPAKPARRYILTCAQNNTLLHPQVWENILALAEHYGARLLVSRFTYNKGSHGRNSVKPGTKAVSDYHDLWYDPAIDPYLCDDRTELAPGLVFCGEMNILPTATCPLSGLESYTGRASGIFPHVRFAMESVASGKHEATKFNWTTGTVTQRNYLAKKAGLKADFHHGYGAVIVEIDKKGRWFVRQLNARDSDGTICDLTLMVQSGHVTDGHRSEAINWGDIHEEQTDPVIKDVAWGDGGMLDELQARYQLFNDLLDFRFRNPHDRLDPHIRFKLHIQGKESVEAEVGGGAQFLEYTHRDWCQSIVVDSNHDRAMEKWLKETDWRHDLVNALFFMKAQTACLEGIIEGVDFHLVEWAMRRAGCPKTIRFLREDESFVLCQDAAGGIECGMHGHKGANGSRGSPQGFAKMGRKANVGHRHSAGIINGVYIAGVSGKLDQGYNKGPSSWSQSHIVTYETGKRAIITMWDGAWRA